MKVTVPLCPGVIGLAAEPTAAFHMVVADTLLDDLITNAWGYCPTLLKVRVYAVPTVMLRVGPGAVSLLEDKPKP